MYNGHTYKLLSNSNWTTAEAKAVAIGGHLATISSAAEDHWVYSTFSTFGGINRDLWIGLNDLGHKGTYTWISGESASYRNWSGGQPDNTGGIEDYVHIVSNAFPDPVTHGKWNDLANTPTTAFSPLFGVVEINAVPEPSSLAAVGFGLFLACRRRKSPPSRL